KTTALNGGITVSAPITATSTSTGTVTLTVLGTGSILSGSQAEKVDTVTVNLTTTSGNIGNRITAFQILASNLNESTLGSVFIDNTSTGTKPTLTLPFGTLAAIGATGTYFLESGTTANPTGVATQGGNIIDLKPIATGSYITIQTLTGGNITQGAALGSAVATTGTKTVTLFTGGFLNSGSIAQSTGTLGAAGGVNLTSSDGGSILGPLGGAFLVNSPSVTANSFFALAAVAPVNLRD